MSNTNSSKTPTNAHRVPFYRRPHVLILAGILLVVLIVLIIILCLRSQNAPTSNDGQSATSSGQATPDIGSDDTTPAPSETDPGQTPSQYEGEDPNTLSGLTGSITLKTYDGSTLTVAAVINQYLSSDGTCQLNLKQNSRTILSETLPATPDVTASGCGPFRLSAPNLSGSYQIEIILSGDNKGGIITDEITI